MMQYHSNQDFTKRPQYILCDLDDTLYEYAAPHAAGMAASMQRAADALKIDLKTCVKQFHTARKQVKLQLGHTASGHSRLLYFHRLIELTLGRSNVTLALELEHIYWRFYLTKAKLLPHAMDFLMETRTIGAGLVLMTDLTASIQFRKLVYLGLESIFDQVISSEEAGTDKIDGKPFELVREKVGISPDAHIWMVGDGEGDCAIKRVFSDAIVFRRIDSKSPKLYEPPDASFKTFEELRRMLLPWLK